MKPPTTRPDVTADVAGIVTVPDGRTARTVVALEYRASRPLEVHAQFRDADTGDTMQEIGAQRGWDFDRQTLAAGCGSSDLAGLGDVRAASAAGNLLLHLAGKATAAGYDRCVIRLPLASVVAFLENTYRLVPAGAESVWPGMDAELVKLLDNDGKV